MTIGMRDAVDEAISCGALESETPGERWERERWERAISRKKSALTILGPLGFVDNDDGETPGAILHPATGMVLDAERLSPAQVVKAIFDEGFLRGSNEVRSQMRRTLGL